MNKYKVSDLNKTFEQATGEVGGSAVIREWIRSIENAFDLSPIDLLSITDEELTNHINFLDSMFDK